MKNTYIAREEMWCEQAGTRLLIEKTDTESVDFTIKLGHISVKATLPYFRLERLVAVVNAKKELEAEPLSHHENCDVNDVNPDGIKKPCNCGYERRA